MSLTWFVLMRFGWDPAKSERNALEIAVALFDGPTVEVDDHRRDYGERRIIAYGIVANRVLVCVYTWRGTADDPIRWIISLRKGRGRCAKPKTLRV